uniref:Pancreatic lipase-related protein 2 n=1 Tax=Cacopsylla melanoneura TaxID=428564 RepID=A0A8D8MA48_9HEMI
MAMPTLFQSSVLAISTWCRFSCICIFLLLFQWQKCTAADRPDRIFDLEGFQMLSNFDKRAIIVNKMGAAIRDSINRRNERIQSRRPRKEICYDKVGCFSIPRRSIAPFGKKTPQSPDDVDTKFWLLTRENPTQPEKVMYSDDKASLVSSHFNESRPTKFIAHGFKGSGKDRGALIIVEALLDLEDCNVVLVDWEKGAAGPSYALAATNTQIIGRQLALLILDMVSIGADPQKIHIVGFSLGAHVAGYAGRGVQNKGVKIGRITGLDPASPLFRQLLATSLVSLNFADAHYVDIIHSDGARHWSEGLGLFESIGHSDYFPNGGLDQPGCEHKKNAVLVSHLEGSMNSTVVCNHIRAWKLFYESLKMSLKDDGCKFLGFHCPGGLKSFKLGTCFPQRCEENSPDGSCGMMGFGSEESRARGALYLVTRDSAPFCGHQMRALAVLSEKTLRTKGNLQLNITTEDDVASFNFHSETEDEISGGQELRALGAAKFSSIDPEVTKVLTITLRFTSSEYPKDDSLRPMPDVVYPSIYIERIVVSDFYGNVWSNCEKDTFLENIKQTNVDEAQLELTLNGC